MIRKLQHSIALERDETSYRQLFLLFHQPLINFAMKIISSESIAEEIYSDTLVKIWLMGEELDNIVDLKHYLFKMTEDAVINEIKKNRNLEFVQIEDVTYLFGVQESPEEKVLEMELHDEIRAIINSLPQKCQLVYRLVREEKFSCKQVAEILDLSVNTVEGHMTSALEKITDSLRHYLISVK